MPHHRLFNWDFRKTLHTLESVDTIFADPPDNIGLGYGEYEDNLEDPEYLEFLVDTIDLLIDGAKTIYISFNAKWIGEIAAILQAVCVYRQVEVRWLIQGFTFGQHNRVDLANNFRPIVRLRHRNAPLFPDACRVESTRMKIGDKRANPAGRVPGDVWFTDFLEYARVVGNSKQRRRWSPTQLNEGVVEDCLLFSTPPGGTVLDPFAGSGTTLRVCLANGWECTTFDVSQECCEQIAREHAFTRSGSRVWGKSDTKT